jgi:hypothetical protein
VCCSGSFQRASNPLPGKRSIRPDRCSLFLSNHSKTSSVWRMRMWAWMPTQPPAWRPALLSSIVVSRGVMNDCCQPANLPQ